MIAQTNPVEKKALSTSKADLEMRAVVNLRQLAMGESTYAMSHPQEGFACNPQTLTKLEWPDSPTHAKLLDPALLSGSGQYKFSARCTGDSKPAGRLEVFAIPLDPHANLRTFCATGTFGPFEMKPYVRTSEFPIRSTSTGSAGDCLVSGEPLK